MITVENDLLRDCIAYGIASKAKAKKHRPVVPQLSGSRLGEPREAEILEFATPDGEVVLRKVAALGAVECWLRQDLALETLVARADAAAEKERIIKEVSAYADATRKRQDAEPTYVLSSALLHAAARHQSRIGRLHDQNSRGDRVRGNLAAALERAAKAGV